MVQIVIKAQNWYTRILKAFQAILDAKPLKIGWQSASAIIFQNGRNFAGLYPKIPFHIL